MDLGRAVLIGKRVRYKRSRQMNAEDCWRQSRRLLPVTAIRPESEREILQMHCVDCSMGALFEC